MGDKASIDPSKVDLTRLSRDLQELAVALSEGYSLPEIARAFGDSEAELYAKKERLRRELMEQAA